jgi:hypothetical protein
MSDSRSEIAFDEERYFERLSSLGLKDLPEYDGCYGHFSKILEEIYPLKSLSKDNKRFVILDAWDRYKKEKAVQDRREEELFTKVISKLTTTEINVLKKFLK